MAQDPYLDRARAALADPAEEPTPAEGDPYVARARAALADEGAGASDYALLPVRGVMRSVTGTLEGLAGVVDAGQRLMERSDRAQGRKTYPGDGPRLAPEAAKLRQYEPDIHPEAEQSLAGQVAETAGGVAGFIGQTALLPGSALLKTAGAGALMGAGAFEQGRQQALADGATPEDADLAGLLSTPAGAIQALPIGRGAARIFGLATNAVKKGVATGAIKGAAEFVGVNTAAKAWAEYVRQEIKDEADAKEVWDAATSGTLPETIVGLALGAVGTWSANRRGARLSEQGRGDLEAVAREVASPPKEQFPPADGTETGEVVPESGISSDETLPPLERTTLIEAPDPDLAAATERFRKSMRHNGELEVHEADPEIQERASKLGLRVVDVDAAEGLPVDGYFDKEARTIFVNRRAEGDRRQAAVFEHEVSHFMDEAHPGLAEKWQAALDEVAPGWAAKAGEARAKRQKGQKLPGLTPKGEAGEARAEAAEGLGTILRVLDAEPALVDQIAAYKPGLVRALIDGLVEFARKLGLTTRDTVRQKIQALEQVLQGEGSGLEKRAGAQGSARLAKTLRELHTTMKVESGPKQPKAQVKPYGEAIGPQPDYEAPIGPERLREDELSQRKNLVDGLPAEDAATALTAIDRKLEDALLRGEEPDNPRMGELGKDRAKAVRLLYEADPEHPALAREHPKEVFKRIKAEDEKATGERRKEQAKRGLDRSKAVQAAEKKIDETAEALHAERLQRAQAEQRAKEKAQAKERKPPKEEIAADRRARKDELKALKKDIQERVKPEPKGKKPAVDAKEAERAALAARIAARLAEREAAESKPAEPEVVVTPEPKPEKKPLPVRAKREVEPDEALPPPHMGEDAPFALPRETREERLEDFLGRVRAGAERDTVRRIIRGAGSLDAAFPVTVEQAKDNLRMYRWPLRPAWRYSERIVRLEAVAQLFLEQEEAARKRPRMSQEPYTPRPSARRDAYIAERRAQAGWLSTFQDAMRDGATQDAAAKRAGEAFPAALEPSRFLAGFDDPAFDEPAFALVTPDRNDGAGVREFLRRYGSTDPHYAATTEGEVTLRARAAAEEFWQKEDRTIAQSERAVREILASKAGKAEVDAYIRGEFAPPREQEGDYQLAAESRVNAILRAAATGNADATKALGLATDYYMLRSQAGYNLRVVQRPRTPSESMLEEFSKPNAENSKKLARLAKRLRETHDKEQRAAIKKEIAEIRNAEAKGFEAGMLALKKAGIDPAKIKDSASAAHAFRIANSAKNKGVWDWILEYRASSMVSAPSSSIAALGGNVANVGWNTILTRLAELPVPKGATAGEIGAIGAALPGAFQKGIAAFWNVLRTDAPSYERQLRDLGLIEEAQQFENAKLSSIPGIPGRVVRGIGLTPMTAVDEFARAIGSELEAVGIAYRRSKGNKAAMAKLLADPTTWEEAVKRTRRSIFQERDNNPLVELGFTAREALDQLGGGKVPVGHLIFPFVQTGVNGVLEGLRKLPGPVQAITLSHMLRGEWKGNPELRARDAAANLLSIGVGLTVWQLASMQDEKGLPYITGSGASTPGQRSLEWRTMPPMSFRDGDQWRSYAKGMPFASVLATMVDAAQDGMNPIDLTRSLLKQAVNSTFFSSMAAIYEGITREGSSKERATEAGRNFAASFVPNLVQTGLKSKDGVLRQDALDKGSSQGIADSIMSRIGVNVTPARYDRWGRQVERGGSFAERYLSPTAPTRNIGDVHTADLVIAAWNRHLPEGEKPWAPLDVPRWYRSRGVTRYMSDPQYEAFQKRAGELAAARLDEATLDPKHPTKAQIERIKRVLSQTAKQAKREVLREIPIDPESDE